MFEFCPVFDKKFALDESQLETELTIDTINVDYNEQNQIFR